MEHERTEPQPGQRPLALLVDTHSLLFRAHHALPAMSTTRGEPTAALYGLCAALLPELARRPGLRLAFAVDAPQRTFRHERFVTYKAQREATPEPVVVQLRRLRQLLAAFAVPVFEAPGFEADDVLATLAARLSAVGAEVLVMSGDRDLFQIAGDGVRVLFLGARGRKPSVYDAARIEERFGVRPSQLPTWVGLVGDASDNLPRVPGVGPRTAARWVRRHGAAAEILDHLEQLEPARLRSALASCRDQVLAVEALATLRRDVPLSEPWALPLSADSFERLRSLFEELEFRSLLPRLAALRPATPA